MKAETVGTALVTLGVITGAAMIVNAAIVGDPGAGAFWLMVSIALFCGAAALIGRALIRPVMGSFFYGAAIALFYGLGCLALLAAVLV